MGYILLIIALPLALVGVVWLFDFFQWYSNGRVLAARIEGFQKKRDTFFNLPKVSIEDKEGKVKVLDVERVDQIIYALVRPKKGDYTTVIVKHGAEEGVLKARVFGYGYVIASLFSILFLFIAASLAFDKALAFSQSMYIALFVIMAGGGWIVLKLIQSSDEL